MKNVTIIITETGFEIILELGEKKYVEKQKLNIDGSYKIENDFENNEEIGDELYCSLEKCAEDCYELVHILKK